MGRIITLDQIRRAKVRLLENPPRMGARIGGGYLHWQVGRYVEPLFRVGPGGVGRKRVWRVEQEAEQHNLILDQCYDFLIPQYGIVPLNRYAVVGTGSDDPSPTQAGLVNEVARTGTVPTGETDEVIYISPGVYDIKRVKEFTETQVGNRNLTEWGFSPSSSVGGNLMCRELFRDGEGNPVVLTLDADQRLRLIYKLRVVLTPVTPQAVTVNIANVGTRTGQFMLTRYFRAYLPANLGGITLVDGVGGDLVVLSVFAAGGNLPPVGYVIPSSNAAPLTYIHSTYNIGGTASPYRKELVYQTPSGRSRAANVLFASTDFVMTIRSVVLLGADYGIFSTPTINLVLDAGQELEKDNLHKLLIGDWVMTWGP